MKGLLPNTKLTHYRIVSKIGEGGMGEVYMAVDTELERKVAIKFLAKEFARDEERLRRFVQEAKAASALNHPNILTIHEVGESYGTRFIASEYISGETLRDSIRRGSLEVGETIEIVIQIASALQAAHAGGIIHRDVKPENIMIRPDGLTKVLDFGLAKLVEQQNISLIGLDDETVRKNQTEKGVILGTVSYMSPEQARGKRVDERTDIFSFGVLIYEMITGRTPFAADSMSETFANLINKEPLPLSRFSSGVPDELQRIVSKMLRKNTDDRYQTMKGLLADLKELKERITIQGKLDRMSSPEAQQDTAIMTRTTGDVPMRILKSAGGIIVPWYRRRALLAIVPALLLGIFAISWYWRQPFAASQPEIKSLAVLPLENLSGDPSQEYFADGMTEALISNLSQIQALRVISRRSIMQYKGSRETLPDIARALGVDAIIDGSVQRSGGRVKVTAQLIPATTNAPMWSRNYERELSDILKLQSDVAQAIAGEIRVQLSPGEEGRLLSARTIDPRAHEAYLLGKFYASKYNDDDIARAIGHFQQAIAIEPGFADAYAGLAEALQERAIWGVGTLADYEAQMREAATTAIRIDPGNSNAHKVMAQLLNNYDHDWTGAEEQIRTALEIDPNSAEALVVYSWLLQSLGRHDEVRPKMERAVQLDPVSSDIQSAFGRMLYRARNYEDAVMYLKRASELEPANYGVYGRLADVYMQMSRWDDAIAMSEKSRSINATGAHELRLAVTYAYMGDRRKALEISSRASNRSAFELARLYTALGEPDQAFEVLNQALDKRDTLLVHLKEDPSFVLLHSDPRWKPLMRRLNFPE